MTERFEKRPGSSFMPSTEDPSMALIMDGLPDDVRLPPDLGGRIEKVVRGFTAPCPRCQAKVRHLELETLCVAECNARCSQFYWYRRRSGEEQAP